MVARSYGSHARARAARASRRPNRGRRAASPLLAPLGQDARAAVLTGADAPRREPADRSQRSRHVAKPRRARRSGAPPPRARKGQRQPVDLGRGRRADRRPSASRPGRRDRLDHVRQCSARARRAASPRARPAASEPRGPDRVGVPRRPAPGHRRPSRTAGRAGRRALALGAGPPRSVRPQRPAQLADRIRHLARARRPAPRNGRRPSIVRWGCSWSRRSGPATAGS